MCLSNNNGLVTVHYLLFLQFQIKHYLHYLKSFLWQAHVCEPSSVNSIFGIMSFKFYYCFFLLSLLHYQYTPQYRLYCKFSFFVVCFNKYRKVLLQLHHLLNNVWIILQIRKFWRIQLLAFSMLVTYSESTVGS